MPDPAQPLIDGLRVWTKNHDPHVRAAVELPIWHDFWLRRPDFIQACVRKDGAEAWINWRHARAFADSEPQASSSEEAVLDLAVAIGENRYRLSIMGTAHSRMIAHAVTAAVGLADPAEWPVT